VRTLAQPTGAIAAADKPMSQERASVCASQTPFSFRFYCEASVLLSWPDLRAETGAGQVNQIGRRMEQRGRRTRHRRAKATQGTMNLCTRPSARPQRDSNAEISSACLLAISKSNRHGAISKNLAVRLSGLRCSCCTGPLEEGGKSKARMFECASGIGSSSCVRAGPAGQGEHGRGSGSARGPLGQTAQHKHAPLTSPNERRTGTARAKSMACKLSSCVPLFVVTHALFSVPSLCLRPRSSFPPTPTSVRLFSLRSRSPSHRTYHAVRPFRRSGWE
jgi:hypothetical protein